MSVKLAPSILSADFGRLAEQVAAAEDAGADWIHVDVMDGHFVPNLTIGPVVVRAVRAATGLPLDVHLMIEDPEQYLQAFTDAGADRITVHQETCPHLHRTIERIHDLGLPAGAAVNPATPVATLRHVAADLQLLLVMSVNPGFGGQGYIPETTRKLGEARAILREAGRTDDVEIQVDGGVDRETAPDAVAAGATVLVAGSAVYRHPGGIDRGVRELREAVAAAPAEA